MLHLRFILTGRSMNSQNSDPWQSICHSQRGQRLQCKLMSSLNLPLLSELIFPLALRAAEKSALGFSWETAVRQAKWANISLFIHTCKQTHRQTGKQTHARSNTIGKVRGSALPDTHGASLPENPLLLLLSLRLSSTPSFAQQLIRVIRACVGLADVCVAVCASPGESVGGSNVYF